MLGKPGGGSARAGAGAKGIREKVTFGSDNNKYYLLGTENYAKSFAYFIAFAFTMSSCLPPQRPAVRSCNISTSSNMPSRERAGTGFSKCFLWEAMPHRRYWKRTPQSNIFEKQVRFCLLEYCNVW